MRVFAFLFSIGISLYCAWMMIAAVIAAYGLMGTISLFLLPPLAGFVYTLVETK